MAKCPSFSKCKSLSVGGCAAMLKSTTRTVLLTPVLRLIKLNAAMSRPGGNAFAFVFMVTVTFVVAPAGRKPLVKERDNQLAELVIFQSMPQVVSPRLATA